MGDRYGACRRCVGHGFVLLNGSRIECGRCFGNGFSGDVMDFLDPQYALRTRRPKAIEAGVREKNMEYVLRVLEWKKK